MISRSAELRSPEERERERERGAVAPAAADAGVADAVATCQARGCCCVATVNGPGMSVSKCRRCCCCCCPRGSGFLEVGVVLVVEEVEMPASGCRFLSLLDGVYMALTVYLADGESFNLKL